MLSCALVAAALVGPAGPAASTADPVTPGTFTGLGFDQCHTPAQRAMTAWRKSSPFRAVGIYISGNSRACRDQPNLTPTWVAHQLAAGWHLLPITLGPQAHCSPRFPRYGASTDPTIIATSAGTYARARAQATAEAGKAVSAAQALGIVPGSTLFYDLEGFDLGHSTNCTQSALWFLSEWSNSLHRMGYLSGVYSSAASGITMLDRARVAPPTGFVLPDQLWIANWHTPANTNSAYISDAGWADQQRIKQYQGGHDETWGKVRINIDRNYLDLRTRAVPGPIAAPPSTGNAPVISMTDPLCTRTSISKPAYRRTSQHRSPSLVVPLQCLLKQQRLYVVAVTGKWNVETTNAIRAFHARVRHPRHGYATRADWVALVSAGSSNTTLSLGSRNADVIRVQRAMNAAGSAHLAVTGSYNRATRNAVSAYQKHVLGKATGVVASLTWTALHRGRW